MAPPRMAAHRGIRMPRFRAGSSNLWVPDSLCSDYATSPSCAVQNKYLNTSSGTFQAKCFLSDCGLLLPYGRCGAVVAARELLRAPRAAAPSGQCRRATTALPL